VPRAIPAGRLLALLLPLAMGACSKSAQDAASPSDADPDTAERTFGGSRPVTVRVPAGYDPGKPAPLVMMLHGSGSSGLVTGLYFKMADLADVHGFFYVAPDGTFDKNGSRFWNATDACCDDFGSGVDDVAYLTALIKEIAGAYAVDPKRIYVMGHSNGGFMAHRLACDHAETVAAIASFAGAVWSDASKCNPSAPVGVLQIHGTADKEVLYGGTLGAGDAGPPGDSGGGASAPYPGAERTIGIWATKNGCSDALVDTGAALHVNTDAKGLETKVSRHDGCAKNGAAELWTVQDAPHLFVFTPEALEGVWKFFESHAR
jgi:polyhydroxybutyrate depolymerase